MMKLFSSLLAGFAGAATLTLLHETIRLVDPEAPRIDILGEEAITKISESTNEGLPRGDALYETTLGGELVANTFYYSLMGSGGLRWILLRSTMHGLIGGLGALALRKPLDQAGEAQMSTKDSKSMTVGYYALAGLVTGIVLKNLRKV